MRVLLALASTAAVCSVAPLALTAVAQTPSLRAGDAPPALLPVIASAAASCPGLPAPLLAAQLQRESGWNAAAVSPAGAQGLAQFMPATWLAHGRDGNADGVADPFDPVDAVWSAAGYDCHLRRIVRALPGQLDALMLAAYNAGPSAVLQHGGIPPYPETQAYVAAVLATAADYARQEARGADGLTPRAVAVRQLVIDGFGVTDIGGFASSGHVEGSDHYEGRAVDIMLVPRGPQMTALGWRIATYLQSRARELGITYMIWDGRIWSPARAAEGWRPYRHPSGSTKPTLQHLDHVHVSVR